MPGAWGTETEFEQTTLERLRTLGYTHAIGAEIAEKHRASDSEVVFRAILREHLTKRYSHLPAESIEEAFRIFARPDDLLVGISTAQGATNCLEQIGYLRVGPAHGSAQRRSRGG